MGERTVSNVPALIKEAAERYQCRMVLAGEKVKLIPTVDIIDS